MDNELNNFLERLKKVKPLFNLNINDKSKKIINEIINDKKIMQYMQEMKSFDSYFYDHGMAVGIVSLIICEKLGYSDNELYAIAVAGAISDYGMIKISDKLKYLTKPLDDDDKLLIKSHPQKTIESIELDKNSNLITELVLNHHERIDGSGYPLGKKSKEINDLTKVLMIVDVFFAIILKKAHKRKRGLDETLILILSLRGQKFDNDIITKIINVTGGTY